jgi:UDP-GlcNAc:undecaprenyl-phosphate GlcNAc-1-phosphate transferase
MLALWTTVSIVLALVLCLTATPLVRNAALRLGLVDLPDKKRKIHSVPIPRLGGIPVVLAAVVSFAALLPFIPNSAVAGQIRTLVWMLWPALALIFIVGVLDDLVGLKPVQKLGGQVVAAVLACVSGLRFESLWDNTFGSLLSVAITLLWLVLCTNAFNLIDGVDGLAAGLGLQVAVTFSIVALWRGEVALAILAAPIAGALLGFLRFNFNPASIFLGDCGSLSVGFLLGCFGILWASQTSTPLGALAPAIALTIPFLDTVLSFARRFVTARPIFAADHRHVHHRLMERGLSARAVTLWLYAATALVCVFALILSVGSVAVGILVLVLFSILLSLAVHSLGYQEFGLFARLLRRLRANVQSELSLQEYGKQLHEATTPEDCWRIVRNAAREFGVSGMTLQFAGRHFEDRITSNGQATLSLRLFITPTDYLSLTCRSGSAMSAETLATLTNLLRDSLCEKADRFNVVVGACNPGATFGKQPLLVKSARNAH